MELFYILYPCIVVIILVYLAFRFANKSRKQLEAIPGPTTLAILLKILEISRKGVTNAGFLQNAIGLAHIFNNEGIYKIWVANFPVAFVFKAETIEALKRRLCFMAHVHAGVVVLQKSVQILPDAAQRKQVHYIEHKDGSQRLLSTDDALDRAPEYQFVAPAFRNGLFTCPAEQWRQRRKLLNPAFYVRILEDCMPIFNKQSRVLVENIKSQSMEMPIDVVPHSLLCSLDIICESAMGVNIESQLGKNTEFVEATHHLLQIVQQRIVQFWLHPDFVFNHLPVGRRFRRSLKIMDDFTTKIILSRKEALLKDSKLMEQIRDGDQFLGSRKKLAFLDLLLYHHLFENKLTEIDVLGEVTTFMVAGHDTSGLTLAWALFLIGHDPRVQENIQKELDKVFAGDKERPITLTDIKELPYLKCVILETLRLYPPGSYIGRITGNDLTVNGYTIPPGTRCIGLIYKLHRDPRYFPKPEAFIPERFLSNSPDRHAYSYVPFSAGPKTCIGQKFAMYELLTILADILRNFSLKSVDARDKIGLSVEFVLVPTNPLRVSFSRR